MSGCLAFPRGLSEEALPPPPRDGDWNIRYRSGESDWKGTSGVCCQGAGPPAGREGDFSGVALCPLLRGEMSGLSHLETEGCRNLLGLLDNDEVMALCDTVTNRLVQPVDRQGRRAGGRQPPAEGSGRAGDAAGLPGARTRGDAAPAAAARLSSFRSPRSPVPGSRRVARWSSSPCPGPTGYSSGDTMTQIRVRRFSWVPESPRVDFSFKFLSSGEWAVAALAVSFPPKTHKHLLWVS